MLSKLKQITTVKNKTFQSFEDVKQTKTQLIKNLLDIQNKIKTSTENHDKLQTIESELNNKMKEVLEFKKSNNIQKLQLQFSESMEEFNTINNKIKQIEENCFEKSKQLQKLIDSFLQ